MQLEPGLLKVVANPRSAPASYNEGVKKGAVSDYPEPKSSSKNEVKAPCFPRESQNEVGGGAPK